MTAITICDLVKDFGSTRALDGLNLVVESGQVHGFLGPNGAGKSTTIRILLGLLKADSGMVRLLGGDPWREAGELHRKLAYVPGDVSLWPNLTGGEAIDIIGRARGGLDPARRAELIERFDLDPTKKGRSYSKGNRQKVALVAALSSDVELLLLDEPTSGLDPLMEQIFADCVRELRKRGATILLSSHILSEVEALCDHISIIKGGRVVESGNLEGIRRLYHTRIVASVEKIPNLSDLSGVAEVETSPGRISFSVDPQDMGMALRRLADSGIRSLDSAPPSLEELFISHYAGDNR